MFSEDFSQEFVDRENKRPLDLSSYGGDSVLKKLPRQLPLNDDSERLLTSADSTGGAMQTIVAGNMLLSFVMSFSMSYLWGMINCLQMIVYLPLLNLQFPIEPQIFLSVLVKVATFDLVPNIDEINDDLFAFNHTLDEIDKRSTGYELMEFESQNFIKNSGSLFIYVLIFVVQVIILFIAKQIATRDLGNMTIICAKFYKIP